MNRLEDIKNLLKRFDYVPVVTKWGDGVIAKMPLPKIMVPEQPRLVEAFAIQREPEPGVFANSTLHPDEQFVGVPEYAIRMFLMADAVECCRMIGINHGLLEFRIGDKAYDDITSIVDPPSSRAERKREDDLMGLYAEARRFDFPTKYDDAAQDLGVKAGYDIVRSFERHEE